MGKVRLIVIGVVGLVLTLPFGVGWLVEERVQNLPDAISKATSGRMDVQVLSYDRGWFRSQAQTRVGVAGTPPEAGVVMNHSISHGPIVIGELLDRRIPRSLGAAVVHTEWYPGTPNSTGDGKPFLTIRTDVGFGQNADVMFEIPPSADPAQGFEWRGLKGSVTTQGDGKQNMEFESPGFGFQGPQGSVSVGTMRGEFDLGASPNGLPVGGGVFSVDQVELTQHGPPQGAFKLRQVKWSYEEEEGLPGETVNVQNNLKIAEFVNGVRQLRDAELQLNFRNLDVQAMRMLETMEPGNSATLGFQATPEHEKVLRLFLARSPELEASIRVTTSTGLLEGTLLISPPRDFPPGPGLASALLFASKIEGKVLLPVSSIPPKLGRQMQTRGALMRQGDQYLMRVNYRNNMLDINGWLSQPDEVVPMIMLVFGSMRL